MGAEVEASESAAATVEHELVAGLDEAMKLVGLRMLV